MARRLQKLGIMRRIPLDAPFWAFLVFGTIALGIVASLTVALANARTTAQADILDTNQIQTARN